MRILRPYTGFLVHGYSTPCYCMRWHAPEDATCPLMTAELMVLKDGDSLDRVRLGDFDPHYLRTPYLVGEQARATQLWRASAPGQPGGPWDRVRRAAQGQGLWPEG
jgi:hypothetical protein